MSIGLQELSQPLRNLEESLNALKSKKFDDGPSEKLAAFFKENQQLLLKYPKNPTIGVVLAELAHRIVTTFPTDSNAKDAAVHIQTLSEERQLPPDIIFHILQFIPFQERQWAISKSWREHRINAKIAWINEHHCCIDNLGFKTVEQLSLVLKVHGHRLQHLDLDNKYFNSITEESLEDLLISCPNLKTLIVKSHLIKELPSLPITLQKLWCIGCPLERLPELPESLEELNCSCCSLLIQLPALPDKLTLLCCHSCRFQQLSELPKSLEELNCSFCIDLTQLPALPAKLKVLDCHGCYGLHKLPVLPEELRDIDYRGCSLQGELELPAKLQVLIRTFSPTEWLEEMPKNCLVFRIR